MAVSGLSDKSLFGSSFTSALLWYRLFPSTTYPRGVLPAILEVTGPMLILIGVNWVIHRRDWHVLRVLGLSAMALVLLGGGLVVSTKIGGGSNIHNLDSFITLVLIVGLYIALGRTASEVGRKVTVWRPLVMVMIVIAMPVLWNLEIGQPFHRTDMDQATYDLNKLQGIVQEYAQEGEVLFITQRQMQVFDLMPGVPMIPDYELLTLSELAISNNQPGLQPFYDDLEHHRFALIVADLQHERLQDPALDAFAEENNAWVVNISPYILKYYERQQYMGTQGVGLYIPRQD